MKRIASENRAELNELGRNIAKIEPEVKKEEADDGNDKEDEDEDEMKFEDV